MKRLLPVLAVACIALVGGVSAAFAHGSGGVTAPSIYVNGVLYRTVGTPTDFSNTGAPDSSFETIYDFGGAQPNVVPATAQVWYYVRANAHADVEAHFDWLQEIAEGAAKRFFRSWV